MTMASPDDLFKIVRLADWRALRAPFVNARFWAWDRDANPGNSLCRILFQKRYDEVSRAMHRQNLEASMKFRVNWSIQQDKWLPVMKRWSSMSPQERANEFPAGGKLLGRWHDMAGRTGVLIVESNDLAAVHRWIGKK